MKAAFSYVKLCRIGPTTMVVVHLNFCEVVIAPDTGRAYTSMDGNIIWMKATVIVLRHAMKVRASLGQGALCSGRMA